MSRMAAGFVEPAGAAANPRPDALSNLAPPETSEAGFGFSGAKRLDAASLPAPIF